MLEKLLYSLEEVQNRAEKDCVFLEQVRNNLKCNIFFFSFSFTQLEPKIKLSKIYFVSFNLNLINNMFVLSQ